MSSNAQKTSRNMGGSGLTASGPEQKGHSEREQRSGPSVARNAPLKKHSASRTETGRARSDVASLGSSHRDDPLAPESDANGHGRTRERSGHGREYPSTPMEPLQNSYSYNTRLWQDGGGYPSYGQARSNFVGNHHSAPGVGGAPIIPGPFDAENRSNFIGRYHSAPIPGPVIPGGYGPEPAFIGNNPFNVKRPTATLIDPSPALAQPYVAPQLSRSSTQQSPLLEFNSIQTERPPHRPSSNNPVPTIIPQLPFPVTSPTYGLPSRLHWYQRYTIIHFLVLIPQQLYLLLLLRLPSLYFSRVSRVFEDANLSLPDIRRMAVAHADQWKDNPAGPSLPMTWHPSGMEATLPLHLVHFRSSWEGFVDSMIKEWKTQNVVSALMLSAILTMLQIDAAASDPIARTTALISLVCALMSLLFGSLYIIRFGTMRKMYKAASWADEAQKGRASILWNVWILLAIPAVWLAWSIILFVTCIMAFAWRTGAVNDPDLTALSPLAARGLRIGVSTVLVLGLIYLFFIIETFRKYGDVMDQQWKEKVIIWAQQDQYYAPTVGVQPPFNVYGQPPPHLWPRSPSLVEIPLQSRQNSPSPPPVPPKNRSDGNSRSSSSPRAPVLSQTHTPLAASFSAPFVSYPRNTPPSLGPALKVFEIRSNSLQPDPFPPQSSLPSRGIKEKDWLHFTNAIRESWENTKHVHRPQTDSKADTAFTISQLESVAALIHLWNIKFFIPHSTETVLCVEDLDSELDSTGPSFYIYLIEKQPSGELGPLPVFSPRRKRDMTIIRLDLQELTYQQMQYLIDMALNSPDVFFGGYLYRLPAPQDAVR